MAALWFTGFFAAGMLFMGVGPAVAACTDPPGPGVDWRQCNYDRYELRGIDLSGANLDGASFNRSQMSETSFDRIDGGRVRFIDAELKNTSFSKARLRYADFTEADLQGASFTDADLANARLVSADLRGADLTGARIRDADFYREAVGRDDRRHQDLCRGIGQFLPLGYLRLGVKCRPSRRSGRTTRSAVSPLPREGPRPACRRPERHLGRRPRRPHAHR